MHRGGGEKHTGEGGMEERTGWERRNPHFKIETDTETHGHFGYLI